MSRSRAGVLTVRLLFASFPLWSLGLLAWVPSLRIALLRRRPRDVAAAVGFGLLTVLFVVMLFTLPEHHDGLNALGGLYTVLFFSGAVTHAVLADRFPREPAAPAAGGFGPPGPYPNPYLQPPPTPGPTPGPPPPAPAGPPPYGTAQPAAPPTPGGSSPRIRQAVSELDELGDLLRGRDPGR